jgi:transcriptional antiterminator NusG
MDQTSAPKTEEKKEETKAEPARNASQSDAGGEKKPAEKTKNERVVPESARWYIVHTYAGHENKVAKSLEQRIETMGFQDRIFDIIVPTRNTIKVSQGKKEQVKEKIFAGYVFIRMILDDESWLLVRTTQGVTAFIGAGNKPTPISDEEVEAIKKFMEMEEPAYKSAFTVGDPVKINDGPFADVLGTVDSVDEARGKLRVLINAFGREVPVELDFLQVTKI